MVSPADAKIFLRFHEEKVEIPEEELDKNRAKGMTLTNGSIFIVKSRKKLKLNEVVRNHKLVKQIEKQMQIYRKKQAEEEQAKSTEPAKTEELLKAYEDPKGKADAAREIEALLSKYQ